MLVAVQNITPRVTYIFEHLFGQIIENSITFTSDINHFNAYIGPKISYGSTAMAHALHFDAHSLLFENTFAIEKYSAYQSIHQFWVNTAYFNNLDIFAASFYLITRYEEYNHATVLNNAQPYSYKNSILYKSNLLQKPVIDYWLLELQQILQTHFPHLLFKQRSFTFTPTIDVDSLFLIKHKPIGRQIASMAKDVALLKFNMVKLRLLVWLNKITDPFYNIIQIEKLHASFACTGTYFYHTGNYHWPDNNVDWQKSLVAYQVQQLAHIGNIGLHPSYLSIKNKNLIAPECKLLQNTMGVKVNKARQHYICIQWPQTYNAYIAQGLKHDYTMGYSQINGFRAGTSLPFLWYSLSEEKVKPITIHPFCIMEHVHQCTYKKMPQEMIAEWQQLIATVKACNGGLISVWHNHSLSNLAIYSGWNSYYKTFLNLVKAH